MSPKPSSVFLHRLERLLRLKQARRSAIDPSSIREQDVFLVSYPRSGNTWVRFLLSNVIKYETGDPIDFHTVHTVIPDYERPDQRGLIDALPEPRIFKSHARYTAHYPRVIYLIRDGRDVAVSYYDYLNKRGQFDGTLAEFLVAKDLPFGTWHKHVQSWLGRKHETNLLLVRYEDLLDDARQELERMVHFVGLAATAEQLAYAVEASSFTQMRGIEETKGRRYGDPTYQFVRRGAAGGWKDHLDERSRAILKARANTLLCELGYAETPDW